MKPAQPQGDFKHLCQLVSSCKEVFKLQETLDDSKPKESFLSKKSSFLKFQTPPTELQSKLARSIAIDDITNVWTNIKDLFISYEENFGQFLRLSQLLSAQLLDPLENVKELDSLNGAVEKLKMKDSQLLSTVERMEVKLSSQETEGLEKFVSNFDTDLKEFQNDLLYYRVLPMSSLRRKDEKKTQVLVNAWSKCNVALREMRSSVGTFKARIILLEELLQESSKTLPSADDVNVSRAKKAFKPKSKKSKKKMRQASTFKPKLKKIVVACVWLAGRRKKLARTKERKKRALFFAQQIVGKDSRVSKWMIPRLSNHCPSFVVKDVLLNMKLSSNECGQLLTKHGLQTKKSVYKAEGVEKTVGNQQEVGAAYKVWLPGDVGGSKSKDVVKPSVPREDVVKMQLEVDINKDVISKDLAVKNDFKETSWQWGQCKDDIPMYDDSGGLCLASAAAGSHGTVFYIITETFWFTFAI